MNAAVRPFVYDPAVTATFPKARAGVNLATGLANGPSSSEMADAYRAEQAAASARLAATPIADVASIAAWRRAFTTFGTKPTQHRNAAEALLRRLSKQGQIPSIGTLVDVGNLVSIRYALPVAVVDRAGVTGTITVRFATGTERFTDLGADDAVAPETGEVIFVDDGDVVCARRWCWRQSAQSATSPSTTEALLVVEGQHDGADDVRSAVSDLVGLLRRYQPAARVTTELVPPSGG